MIFRRAREADLASIVVLLAADQLGATREDASLPLAPEYLAAFSAIEADENQYLAVCEHDGGVIATLHLTFIPGLSRKGSWRGQIEAVRVAVDYRGKRIGEAFFQWAIEQCKARRCSLVQLTTDKTRDDAHRFYDRLGFEPSHTGYKLKF